VVGGRKLEFYDIANLHIGLGLCRLCRGGCFLLRSIIPVFHLVCARCRAVRYRYDFKICIEVMLRSAKAARHALSHPQNILVKNCTVRHADTNSATTLIGQLYYALKVFSRESFHTSSRTQ